MIKQADIEKEKTVSVGSASGLDYPKKSLVCTGDVKPMNIVFLFVDALRSDVVTPENMPQLSAFARTQDTSVFTEFPAGSPGLEPREECGLSKFFNLGPNAAKPCT